MLYQLSYWPPGVTGRLRGRREATYFFRSLCVVCFRSNRQYFFNSSFH